MGSKLRAFSQFNKISTNGTQARARGNVKDLDPSRSRYEHVLAYKLKSHVSGSFHLAVRVYIDRTDITVIPRRSVAWYFFFVYCR